MKYRIFAMLLLCGVLAYLYQDSGQPSPAPEAQKSSDDNTFKSIKIE